MIENRQPKPIEKGDHIKHMFINERFDLHAVLESGRVFKQRAIGHGGTYDRWREYDVIGEIIRDITPKK